MIYLLLKNGVLANPFEALDFSHAILWLLKDKDRYKTCSENAKRRDVTELDILIIRGKILSYMKIY